MKDWKTVLAVTDFSDSATNAAWRAGRVACQHGARLSLLHVIAATEPAADPAAAERRLRALASRLRDALGLSVDCRVVRGDPQQEIADAARSAGVLVLGSRRRNTLREFLMGTAAERLIRLARIPVLVVKREAGPDYRRVLVPVELAPHADVAIAAALDFSPGARVSDTQPASPCTRRPRWRPNWW
jgi:nucleotide-binding universal stress UspA family protein